MPYLYLTVSRTAAVYRSDAALYHADLHDVMSQRRLRWGYAFSALLAVAPGLFATIVTDHFG